MISGQSEPRDFVQVNPAFALDVHQPRALFVLTQARITGEQKLASPVRNNPFEEFLVGGAKGPFALNGSLRTFKRPLQIARAPSSLDRASSWKVVSCSTHVLGPKAASAA